jgi:ubiquinone/menaquinone biosynthesis C-methylase UbiE
VKPETYDAWYRTPRGQWIGSTEYSLLNSLLRPTPGSSLLDIGCGTGHFTRMFARQTNGLVVGLDPNEEWLAYAQDRSENQELYVAGRAEALPFADQSFDCTLSVTALCFVTDQMRALREMVRVTRRRFVLGLLNRHSILYLEKGRHGGSGGYEGAHWHTAAEVRALLGRLAVPNVLLRTAVVMPCGGRIAQAIESLWPRGILLGGFLAVSGDLGGAT